MGQLNFSSCWDEICMKRIVDTDILSSGVACKDSDNWNGLLMVKILILSVVL